jgi:hypothetical protein
MDDFTACLGCNQTLGIGVTEYCPRCFTVMDLQAKLARANAWPASERGDRTPEYWEGPHTWEQAHRDSRNHLAVPYAGDLTEALKYLERMQAKHADSPRIF